MDRYRLKPNSRIADGTRIVLALAVGLGCFLFGVTGRVEEKAPEAKADAPKVAEPTEALPPEPPVTDSDRDHWAFLPLTRPPVPDVENSAWPRNAIDRFVLAKLEAEELQPMPPADRVTLIRRVTFDLTGLPPSPADVQDFLEDSALDAYERLVDRLLASPEYGVRWGQHWLDLARFAETDGFEHDNVRPQAFRYRDWVVDALNADLPYDRFVQMQIAGDVLYTKHPGDPAPAIATGFLLCGPDMPDINLQEERRHNVLNEMTSTVGSVFMGMQIGCAQCHDHKFDPISQRDFYRQRAFFENGDIFRDHPIPSAADIARKKAWETERSKKLAELETIISQLEQAAIKRSSKEGELDLTKDYEAIIKTQLTADEQKQYKKLTAEWERVRKKSPPKKPAMGRVMREKDGEPNRAYLWIRGDFRRQGPELKPAFLRVANPQGTSPEPAENPRLELARWLTRPDHPLVTRVMANRLWQHHFGKGLSASPSNFGIMGFEPTHPELLDWLAAELATDWSLKRMHRLLVTSQAYRMASRPQNPRWTKAQNQDAQTRWKQAMEADPENELLTRMRRRRLEGEAIRDTLLAVTGELSDRREGPGVRPPLPPELLSTLLKNQWPVSPDAKDHHRRSLYLFVRRNLRFPIFEVFDQPDTNASCPVRARSTIAPQSLTMLNSTLTFTAAGELADLVLSDSQSSDAERIRRVFLKILSREPTAKETAQSLEFLQAQTDRLRQDEKPSQARPQAWRDFCLAMFNTNEFLYID